MTLEKLFDYLVYLVVVACLIAAIFDIIEPGFLPDGWHIPAIFSVLFSVFHFIFKIPNIENKLIRMEGKIQATGFQRFDNTTDYYNALLYELESCSKELLLMHVRNKSTPQLGARSGYFEATEKWRKRHPDGVVKRISSISNDHMLAFSEGERKKARQEDNYYFRVLKEFKNNSMLQINIFDRKGVFFTIPGTTSQQSRALFIDDPEVVQYCLDYYENVWAKAVDDWE